MKKIVSLIICVLLMTALCACTGGEETKEQLVPDVSDLSGLDRIRAGKEYRLQVFLETAAGERICGRSHAVL